MQDIEIIINDADQERAFAILTSDGFLPSIPDENPRPPDMGYTNWREQYSSPSHYRDRRKFYHGTPIYELPPRQTNPNPEHDSTRPWIIIYSAEFAGLAPIPSWTNLTQDTRFAPLSALPKAIAICHIPTDLRNCLVPTFESLVESEMHVLLQHTELKSASWAHHMDQLSALAHSGCCYGGMDGLSEIVSPRFKHFTVWIWHSQRGRQDYRALKRLQSDYKNPRGRDRSSFAVGIVGCVVSIKAKFGRRISAFAHQRSNTI